MNEKIKTIAEFDGWVKRDIAFTHGRELYENEHHTQWLDSMPYLTDLNALHRVALDVMDRLYPVLVTEDAISAYCKVKDALLSRPVNGQYTDLIDAVYDAIVYLKKHDLCYKK